MRIVGPNTITDGPNTMTLTPQQSEIRWPDSFGKVTMEMSDVVMLVEVIPTTCWMAPVEIQESDLAGDFSFSRKSGVGSMHTQGTNIGMMDGSVSFMPDNEAHQLKDRVKIKP